MEISDNKLTIKSEPIDDLSFGKEEETKELPIDTEMHMHVDGSDDEVAEEFGVVLLRPHENATLSRLLFQQRRPQEMKSCTGRSKKQVQHVELHYQTKQSDEMEGLGGLYDGVYNGENLEKDETLLRHAAGFFKSGRFFMIPIQETYEMHRKIDRPKKVDVIEQNKIDDEKLAQIDSNSDSNQVRVAFTRAETDWQKKRREQSAQYKQQVFDNDPWINLKVQKTSARKVFDERIKDAEEHKPAIMNQARNLPVL